VERPNRGATTADRAGTSELLTSALESGTGELLTSRPLAMEACASKLRTHMLTCVVVEAAHRTRISPAMEALGSSSPIMEALCLELAELPAAGRVSLPAARAAAPKAGVREEPPPLFWASVSRFFLCCNRCILVL
jgi:hypothetical protein